MLQSLHVTPNTTSQVAPMPRSSSRSWFRCVLIQQLTESVKAACLGANPRLSIAPCGDGHHTLGANNVFFVVLDNQQHSAHFCKEDAQLEAAQLDFTVNSPELNDGVQGTHEINILSFTEMMESPVEMVL